MASTSNIILEDGDISEDLEALGKLCKAFSYPYATSIDIAHCTMLGHRVLKRNRKVFPDVEHSPVHSALKISSPQRKDVLKLLLAKLGFRSDSVIRNEIWTNYTPAHMIMACQINDRSAVLEQMLNFLPDLTIVACFKNAFTITLTGNVEDFAFKYKRNPEKRILEAHKEKLLKTEMILKINKLNQEKQQWEAEKQTLVLNNNNVKTELEEIIKETTGVNADDLLTLKRSKAELEKAIEIQTNVKDCEKTIQRTVQQYERMFSHLKSKLEGLKQTDGFKTDEEINALKEKIVRLKKRKFENEVDNCPICIEIPAVKVEIQSCQNCGGIFCKPCVVDAQNGSFKVEKCPLCQIGLGTRPMIRNLFAEKCIRNYNSKE